MNSLVSQDNDRDRDMLLKGGLLECGAAERFYEQAIREFIEEEAEEDEKEQPFSTDGL